MQNDLGKESVSLAGNFPKESPHGFLYNAVSKAMAVGCFKADCREVAEIVQLLWSGLHGVITLHLIRGRFPEVAWRPISAAKESMIECMLGGLTNQRLAASDPERW